MMEVMVKRCAGIDVHKKTITVCTLVGSLNRSKPKKQTKEFDTTTRDLQACAQWLESLDITTVLMESTGQYWRPVWHILEPYGFKMILANAQHIKQVPGRKTDMRDAQWIAELGRCRLVSDSLRGRAYVQGVMNQLAFNMGQKRREVIAISKRLFVERD